MRGLKDISILAAAVALAVGVVGAGCSAGDSSVDAAPPAEELPGDPAQIGETEIELDGSQLDEEEEW